MSREIEQNFIGYLLKSLTHVEQQQVEEHLQSHPEARHQVEKLRSLLSPLAADSECPEPPSGLAMRTVQAFPETSPANFPRYSSPPARSLGPVRPFWRRMDVLVAAAMIFVVIGVSVPWLYRSQVMHGRVLCQDSLREIWAGLQAYAEADKEKQFPNVATIASPPRNVAGLVLPKLIALGFLSKKFVIRCPGGEKPVKPEAYEDAVTMDERKFKLLAKKFTPCYGYTLGYQDENGFHGPGFKPEFKPVFVAIVSDGPPENLFNASTELNSPNHHGLGQNVLFANGTVKFCESRIIEGDDLFLNERNEVGAGLKWNDNVIGASHSRP